MDGIENTDPAATRSGDPVRDSQLMPLFKQMVLIRKTEEALIELCDEGLLTGAIHTCLGQEACAVGVISALDQTKDIVCSNHRGHGHFLAYCGDVRGLIAEVMGRPEGVCGGVGGSQHLHMANFYSNGILGGMSPIAAGMAIAEKLGQSGAVSVVFHGDGALGEGVIYETMNLAGLWELPLLFVIEANQYAQSTPIEFELAGTPEKRARAFGVAVTEVDGNDVLAVREAAARVIDGVRRGQRPALLYLRTYRLGPHGDGDDARDPAEIERHRPNDPIMRARQKLDPKWCDGVDESAAIFVKRMVDDIRAN